MEIPESVRRQILEKIFSTAVSKQAKNSLSSSVGDIAGSGLGSAAYYAANRAAQGRSPDVMGLGFSMAGGLTEKGLLEAPRMWGQSSVKSDSYYGDLAKTAGDVIGYAPAGSAAVAGKAVQGLTMTSLNAWPTVMGQPRPSSTSTTGRLNRFASRVVGGATTGAMLGLAGGPFAEVTVPTAALGGAAIGGITDLADTTIELGNEAIKSYDRYKMENPEAPRKMSWEEATLKNPALEGIASTMMNQGMFGNSYANKPSASFPQFSSVNNAIASIGEAGKGQLQFPKQMQKTESNRFATGYNPVNTVSSVNAPENFTPFTPPVSTQPMLMEPNDFSQYALAQGMNYTPPPFPMSYGR